MQLNYDQKLKLVALTQQANHGTFSEENLPALGALDVIGKDRRNAWASLGDISKDESMKGFIDGVAESMPHLQPHIEAIKKEKESIKKQELEAQEKAAEEAKIAQEADEERQRFGFCEKYILSILSDFLSREKLTQKFAKLQSGDCSILTGLAKWIFYTDVFSF